MSGYARIDGFHWREALAIALTQPTRLPGRVTASADFIHEIRIRSAKMGGGSGLIVFRSLGPKFACKIKCGAL
jgi:hypothetical protein